MAKDCKTCSFEANCDDASRDMFGCAIRDRQQYLGFKDSETVCVDCIHQGYCPGKAYILPGDACAGRAVKMASAIIEDAGVEDPYKFDPASRHYSAGGLEVQDVIKAKLTPEQYEGFCLGNVMKYALRANWKGSFKRDVEKAGFYAKFLREFRDARS